MLKLADQTTKLAMAAEDVPEPVSGRSWSGWLFLLCLGIVALLAGLDTDVRLSVLRAATGIKTAGEVPGQASPSLATGGRSTILHAPAMDARWWVIHAEESSLHGKWRIRDTHLDNAPEGREVHWSSGPIWMLRVIAAGLAVFSGSPAHQAIQQAALWFGPITLALGLGLISLLVGKRFGWGYAGLLALILTTALPVYGNFRVGEPDHHGLVLFFLLGSVLSLVAGGAGLVRQPAHEAAGTHVSSPETVPCKNRARQFFALAGVLGSAGMWISAATTIPVLAGCGIGALAAAALSLKNARKSPVLAPELWRVWSRWGAGGCVAFYLLEYFPGHMGWRLEVNHPLYALAWLGAGEILCLGCAWLGPAPPVRHPVARLVAGLAFLAAPVVLITFAASAVFWVADPFLLALHKDHIREFGPLLSLILHRGDLTDWVDYFAWPLFAILGLVALLRSRIAAPWPSLLAVAFAPALLMQMLAFAQVRWETMAVGLWSVCALCVVLGYFRGHSRRRIPRWLPLATGVLATAALATFPQLVVQRFLARTEIAANLPQSLAPVVLLRDVAHRLVQSSPARTPVVLSDPTSSTELAYFGGIRVFGTLYWENRQGLEKSAWLFTAPDENTARERFRSSGVTHLVLPSWDDFTPATFLELLQTSGKAPRTQKTLYLDAVVQGTECPQWLRPHYYPIPAVFGLSKEWIRVFEVRFDQSLFDSWLYRGVYYVEAGDYHAAQRMLEKAREADPANPDVARWLAAVSRKVKMTQPQKSIP